MVEETEPLEQSVKSSEMECKSEAQRTELETIDPTPVIESEAEQRTASDDPVKDLNTPNTFLIDRYLPEAQTCFFSLILPNYSTVEVLKEKLLQAITSCKAIDTDFMVRDATSRTELEATPALETTSSHPLRDSERRRRRQLLRSVTHNSSEHSHQESALFSEESFHLDRAEAESLLLELEKSYESYSQTVNVSL